MTIRLKRGKGRVIQTDSYRFVAWLDLIVPEIEKNDTILFSWHGWPYFYFTGQCSWIHI